MNIDKTCEFCTELIDFKTSRLGKIYLEKISSRIIKESEHFFVIPTIGQLLPGSLLILPKAHIETFAEIKTTLLPEALDIINELTISKNLSNYILWEHGAKKCSHASCGVFHAHIHLIPLPKKIIPSELLGKNAFVGKDLIDTLKKVAGQTNYIFFRNTDGKYYFNTEKNGEAILFQSQYFRKWLVHNFSIQREWDWKKYNHSEVDLLNAIG